MIEILRCTDIQIIKEFGFDISSATVVMTAKDKDEVFGAGAIDINGDVAVFREIKIKEEFKMLGLEHGMGKSLLNLADLDGVRYVFSDSDDERLMKMLRFKENTAEIREEAEFLSDEYNSFRYFLDLNGYFTVHSCG